jgi:hypothetical protein
MWVRSKEDFDFTAQGVTDREEFPMPPSGIVFLFDVDNTLLDHAQAQSLDTTNSEVKP